MADEKVKKAKTISIKNKKAVKQTLAKASIKGQKATKKPVAKTTAVKKKPKVTTIVTPEVEEKEIVEKIKKTTPKTTKKAINNKKTKIVKEPNNIKRKISKAVEETKEDIAKDIETKKEALAKDKKEISEDLKEIEKEIISEKEKKKQAKKKAREEKRRKRKEKKLKRKEEKKKLREKKLKEKKAKAELKKKKGKIELPKEWKTINSKNKKTEKSIEETPKTFKGKIKSSIFESVDERELEERKRQGRESLKKTLIIFLILGIIIGVTVYALLKYNDYVRKQLAVYQPFRIGDTVKLQDDSKWYVIKDSDSKEDSVKLLADKMVDINSDGIIDNNDAVKYNSTDKAEYDSQDENSVAYLLDGWVRKIYEDSIGKVSEMSILTSKEYVKIRERMNFGDEWNQGNWLADGTYQKYWILSDQNDKVFVVTSRGTFILTNASKSYYMRPTVVISKDLVTKLEEKKEITMDLINGLKRK